MNQFPEPDISPVEIARVFLRHRWLMLLTFMVTFGGVLAYIATRTPVYRYEAKLFLRLGRESVLLDPTVTAMQSQSVSTPANRDNELNSTVDLLRSRMLLEQLVDSLGANRILGKETDEGASVPGSEEINNSILANLRWSSKSPREKAIREVQSSLSVAAVKDSNVISVSFESPSADISKDVVQAIIEIYQKEHIRINRAPGAYDFLLKQTEAVREQLDKTEQEWRDLKNETGITSVEDQKRLSLESLESLENALRMAKIDLSSNEAMIEALEQQLSKIPEMRESSRADGQLPAGADSMRGLLYALELREKELSAKYTDEHHLVKELRKQVEQSRALLAKESNERSESVTSTNKVFEETESLLVKEVSQGKSLKEKIVALTSQIARCKEELNHLNEIELRFAQLERETELQDANYRRYAENLEKARIDQALDLQRISNINVVQPERAPERPVDSNAAIKLIVGLFASVLASCTVAFIADRFQRAIKKEKEGPFTTIQRSYLSEAASTFQANGA